MIYFGKKREVEFTIECPKPKELASVLNEAMEKRVIEKSLLCKECCAFKWKIWGTDKTFCIGNTHNKLVMAFPTKIGSARLYCLLPIKNTTFYGDIEPIGYEIVENGIKITAVKATEKENEKVSLEKIETETDKIAVENSGVDIYDLEGLSNGEEFTTGEKTAFKILQTYYSPKRIKGAKVKILDISYAKFLKEEYVIPRGLKAVSITNLYETTSKFRAEAFSIIFYPGHEECKDIERILENPLVNDIYNKISIIYNYKK